jgi:hypothetical protein
MNVTPFKNFFGQVSLSFKLSSFTGFRAEAELRAAKLAFVLMLAWTRVGVEFLEHDALLAAECILRRSTLHLTERWLVAAWSWSAARQLS